MEKIKFETKQKLINALCVSYADFLNFDLTKMDFDNHSFDKIYKLAVKINALRDCFNHRNIRGKCYLLVNSETSAIMPVDTDNRYYWVESSFQYYLTSEDVENVCYLIDFDNLTAEKISGADILSSINKKHTY